MIVNSPTENKVVTVCIITSDTGETACKVAGNKYFQDWLDTIEADTKTNYSVFYQRVVVQVPKPIEKPKVKFRVYRIDNILELSGSPEDSIMDTYFKNMKIDYEYKPALELYQGITEDGTIFHYHVMEPKKDAS